jgi:DNA repair exonuclease SbcCD nuclease subunit
MKFIHAADIHLDSPLRGLERYEDAPVDEVRSATRQAFENLVEFAIEEEVAFVLLAGDLYDGDWPDHNTGLFFIGQMNRLRGAEIPVHLVSGNHDAASQITKNLKLPDNVTHYSHKKPQTVTLDDLGVAIHGQSFSGRSVTRDLAADYPVGDPALFNIGLLHTSLDGRPGHNDYAPCSLDTLRSKGYRYWALGHVHRREEVAQDPWVVFAGNIQGRHARETGPKGCTLVTVEDAEVIAVEAHELDVLRWAVVSVDVANAASGDSTIEYVRRALEEELDGSGGRLVAARLVLEGSSEAHADLARDPERWIQEYRAQASALASPGVWLEKVQLNTQQPVGLARQLERDDALGDLLRMIVDLESAPLELESLAEEFSDLKSKLPPELTSGDDALNPTDPELLKTALLEVKEILLARLLQEGGRA